MSWEWIKFGMTKESSPVEADDLLFVVGPEAQERYIDSLKKISSMTHQDTIPVSINRYGRSRLLAVNEPELSKIISDGIAPLWKGERPARTVARDITTRANECIKASPTWRRRPPAPAGDAESGSRVHQRTTGQRGGHMTTKATRRAVAGGLGSASVGVLAACGQGASTPPQASKSAAPVTLRVSSWLVEPPSVQAYNKHLIEPFKQEAPNTTVAVEAVAFSVYPEKLQAYGASNDLPDVIEVSYAWFPEWVKLGWLENLDAVVKRDKLNLADYDKTVTGMGKWPYEKGSTYSWWTMMGIGTFYYNKSMFDREGQKYSDENWTWDQAVEVAN